MVSELDAVIIGGGLAGLSCARQLCAEGLDCRVLEAADDVGGRVRTDACDGFLLDRGFQVFLTAYPEASAVLDYDALNLRRFEPGALVRFNGAFHRFADPWRRPQHLLKTALSPVASLSDKIRVARFRAHTCRGDLQDVFERPEQPTIDLLHARGFSSTIIERFFRPFLGGVFLDHELRTSSRMCEFVFRMFSQGDAALPKQGMGEIPRQLAGQLPSDVLRLNSPVDSIEGHTVILASGERLAARHIIVATEAPTAAKLLGTSDDVEGQSVSCVYFATEEPPISEPILVLNGDGEGPVNNLCVPSQVSHGYAPAGQSLVSVTVLGKYADSTALQNEVTRQLTVWFGNVVASWRHLRTYDIRYALPNQAAPRLGDVAKPTAVGDRLYVCGDHRDTASINGAMASGRRAAESVIASLAKDTVE